MLSGQDILLFMAVTLAINLTPGPSIAYIVGVVARNGVPASITAAFGLALGILCHVLAAALGVTALLLASDVAFFILKSIGAGYLVFLGLRLLFTGGQNQLPKDDAQANSGSGLRGIFMRGVLVDLLNPKIGLFFLALLPQFVTAGWEHAVSKTVALGVLFVVTGTMINIGIAIVSGRAISHLGGPLRLWLRSWIPGTILIGLGARLAFAEK